MTGVMGWDGAFVGAVVDPDTEAGAGAGAAACV